MIHLLLLAASLTIGASVIGLLICQCMIAARGLDPFRPLSDEWRRR